MEKIILSNLIFNDDYTRKVLPYLKSEYFTDNRERQIFITILNYINKYKSLPSKEALYIDIGDTDINDEEEASCLEYIENLKIDSKTSSDWVAEQTEEFCKKKSMYLALTKSLQIYENKDGTQSLGSIPGILQDALSISFDSQIGHDYFDDSEKRYEAYHTLENKIPFDIDILNTITRGGVSKKTLTIWMAGVHAGKSSIMCHQAAANLLDGRNVLYISLEMSEDNIIKRIDANLMDLTMDEVNALPKDSYLSMISSIKRKTVGKLKVKEYPTAQAGAAHFRFLINELKLKQSFIPDIVYIDYLNICASSRLKTGKASLYEYVKAISEEIRGLSVEFDIAVVTATQFNRQGFKSSDAGMEDVAESFGTNATADNIFALIRTEELDKLNQIMIKQLKNRDSNPSDLLRFVIGIDFNKMKFYNVEDSEQTLLNEKKEDKIEKFITRDMEESLRLNKNVFDDF